MTDSLFSSPARSLGERSLGDPNSLTDSDMTESEFDVFEMGPEVPANSDQVVVDGWLKFRDNKKWKQRWGVVTKLSPAADCLHLQLYRDSRDRYKQGQTKASLSLQHFLGVETGFTLDKESNTIAIICQDVTVVLAFDTRERLIQWQVKICCHLGEDQQFLVLVSQAPSKAKISTGPARVHIQEMKFCMTSGVPPRLIGIWEIGHLRRYGVIEGRFCFEGGSRCGKGEGLYVLVTDQSGEITRTLQMAAQGKLTSRRPQVIRKTSVINSPKKLLQSRQESRGLDIFNDNPHEYLDGTVHGQSEHPVGSPYWSVESRQTDLDSNYGCGDTASVHMHGDAIWSTSDGRTVPASLERCVSCISKLGAPTMSRSSTANTSTLFSPAWTMEPVPVCTHQNIQWGSSSDRTSVSSHGTGSSDNSEYSISKHFCQDNRLVPSNPPLPPKSNKPGPAPQMPTCHCHPPNRPPKPAKEPSPTRKKIKKPPMPLPPEPARQERRTPEPEQQRLLDNYDVPRNLLKEVCDKQPLLDPSNRLTMSPTPFDYYDTPKNLKENLCCTEPSTYANYDTLPPAKTLRKPCGCVVTFARQAVNSEPRPECPCQRVLCWAENWMMLPYCRKGQGVDNTAVPIHKVKLSGEGKMPVVNASGEVAIYATIDKSKKNTKKSEEDDSDHPNINYENIDLEQGGESENKGNAEATNYENLAFAQSLDYYENSKNLIQKAGISHEEMTQFMDNVNDKIALSFSLNNGLKVCNKCGHTCDPKENTDPAETSNATPSNPLQLEDYLVMKPSQENTQNAKQSTQPQNSSEYLPMYPGNKVDEIKFQQGKVLPAEKSASVSSLPTCTQGEKRRDSDARIPGSAIMVVPSSANPCIKRLLNLHGDRNKALPRKRSSSADSSRYLEDYDEPRSRDSPVSSPCKSPMSTDRHTSNSLTSLPYQSSSKEFEHRAKEVADVVIEEDVCERTIVEDLLENKEAEDCRSSEGSLQTLVHEGLPETAAGNTVHIRRSSSVPCKSGNNRDSSSSNDSGVSTGSLRLRNRDFPEFELPPTTTNSSKRHQMVTQNLSAGNGCLHASLPRRSKSSDPLREFNFHFQVTKIQAKSSSAEAEVPVCTAKKGYFSPGDSTTVPYMDSRSTSSGTSDMSDYIETLSLSSHSSSEAPDSFTRIPKVAATTLRPRSGNEYHKIDRSILNSDALKHNQRGHYVNVEPLPEKSESPSPGYASGSPAHEVQCVDF